MRRSFEPRLPLPSGFLLASVLLTACNHATRHTTSVPVPEALPKAKVAKPVATPETKQEPNEIASDPPTAEPIGTAHPTHVQAVAQDGSWAVICQTRSDTNGDGVIRTGLGRHGDFFGDAIEPYLVLGSGAGEPIDSFVAADPNGRFLAYVQDGELVLLDTETQQPVRLHAEGKDDSHPLGQHRAGSFNEEGDRFLFIRPTPTGEYAVVRNLVTGDEQLIDHGEGRLWRASFLGDYVLALIHPKAQSLALPHTTLSARRCRGPISSYSTFGRGGVGPTRRLFRPEGDDPIDSEGIVTVRADGILRRLKDQSLVWENAAGKRTLIVPADCGGRLVNTWKAFGPVLAACTGHAQPPPLVWFDTDDSRPLSLAADAEQDVQSVAETWSQWSDGRSHFVEMSTGNMVSLGTETRLLVSHGDKVYLHRSESSGFHKEWNGYIDWRTKSAHTLAYDFPKYPRGAVSGAWYVVQPPHSGGAGPIIDMDSGRVVGGVTREPLAVSDTGWVLMPAPRPRDKAFVHGPPFQGPLHWYKPGDTPAATPRNIGEP